MSKPIAASNSASLDDESKTVVNILNNNSEKEPSNNVINKDINNAVDNNFGSAELTAISLPNSTAQTAKITEGDVFDKLPMKKVLALGRVKDEESTDNQTVIANASKVLSPMEILKPNLLKY